MGFPPYRTWFDVNTTLFVSFVAAAGLLAIVPGPGVLFVLAQTTKGGKATGLSASLGTAIGGLFHVMAGAVGLSALVYSSSIAFEVVKVLGAFYLFFLGLKSLREKKSLSIESPDISAWDSLRFVRPGKPILKGVGPFAVIIHSC